MSLEDDMRGAAWDAARFAAGEVVGAAVAKAHPELPTLRWSAVMINGTWYASGIVPVEFDAATMMRALRLYADALGGTDPHPGDRDAGALIGEMEITAEFERIKVTVIGLLAKAGDQHSYPDESS